MSQAQTIQQSVSKSNKKTAVDYVAPHLHHSIPNALDIAKNEFYNERISKVINLAYSKGASIHEVASTLGLDPALVSRKFPKGENR